MKEHLLNHGVLIFSFLRFSRRTTFCIFSLLVLSSQLKGDESETADMSVKPKFLDQVSASVYGGWDSHYFTEGRDLLEGDALIITDIQSSWEFIFWQIWYAASPEQSYDELQFMAGGTQTIGNFTYYAGHRHIQFPADGLNDDEAAVGVSMSNLPVEIQLSVDAYYSFEAEGFFTEIIANRSFAVTERVSVNNTVIFGINQDYISDGHDGANHFALTIGLNYAVSNSVSIVARLTQSWEIDRDPNKPGDETLVDFFNGGIGMQWSL